MALPVHELFVCRKFIPVTRNEKCNCFLMEDLRSFFEYGNQMHWPELVMIVARSSLKSLKCFIQENKHMRIVDRHGNSPLHLSIIFNKRDVFDYLLENETVNLNALNRLGQTCLYISVMSPSEYYTSELLRRGADPYIADESCCTPLHAAALKKSPRMCQLLLEGGADIDARNLLGKTPIYHACQYGSLETIYMLLYYGADVTITDRYGVLPITLAMQLALNCDDEEEMATHREMHEVFFNYTFGRTKIDLNITTFTVAMKLKSPLFPEMLRRVARVRYCRNDLTDFSRDAIIMDQTYFKMFTKKFGYVIKDMLKANCNDLYYKVTLGDDADNMVLKLMDFLTLLGEGRRNLNFFKGTTAFSSLIPVLVSLFKDKKITMKTLSGAMCFLYSYGLTCELNHLITVYENCGFCELFKILLHMDIYVTYEQPKSLMPYLICDIHMTLDKLMNYIRRPTKRHRSTLKFFSAQKVKNFFARDEEMEDHIDRLPQVPTLVELSRNVARTHIINTFRIEKTRDFYTLLKAMPIPEVYKKILTYEKELYPFQDVK